MNKNKLIYEAPEAQTFVIRFEGNIMSPNYGQAGHAGNTVEEDYEYEL